MENKNFIRLQIVTNIMLLLFCTMGLITMTLTEIRHHSDKKTETETVTVAETTKPEATKSETTKPKTGKAKAQKVDKVEAEDTEDADEADTADETETQKPAPKANGKPRK